MPGEVETMAYAREVPWHGLGKPVNSNLSVSEMLTEADILWTVSKHQAFIEIPGLERMDINRCALVRDSDNKILDTVPNDWHPLQNEEAFEFFNEFVKAGDMEMHTAGSLKGGLITWALAKMRDGFMVGGKDQVDGYMLFTNPHQFGKAIDIRATPIRVVCWNTMSMALGKGGSFDSQQIVKMSHRSKFDMDKAKMLLGLATSKIERYHEVADFLASKRYDNDKLRKFFGHLFPKSSVQSDPNLISRNHSLALKLMDTQPGAELSEGSWWQAFNAVTYMTDHVMGRSVDTRLQSAWFGSNRDLKTKALELAVELAS